MTSSFATAPRLIGRCVACLMILAPLSACNAGNSGTSSGPPPSASDPVVLYTSVDQAYAEPVLADFEVQTGIDVLPVFDVEAAKTTGLVNRLIAEKTNPQADVWWNGEFAQTIELAERGILTAYFSPNAAAIPADYKDALGRWTGFGGRARVLLVNTELVNPVPGSIMQLLDPGTASDRIGIAYPVFGTSATHAAALYALWGREEALKFYRRLADRGIRVVDGNSVVRDLVAEGQLAIGLTDTDDACGAVDKGAPVEIVFPDQHVRGLGTLIIPNTVGMVAGAPHPDVGRKLIDYLLSPATEAKLIEIGFSQITLRPLPPGSTAKSCVDTIHIRGMDVSLTEVAAQIEAAKVDMAELFVR